VPASSLAAPVEAAKQACEGGHQIFFDGLPNGAGLVTASALPTTTPTCTGAGAWSPTPSPPLS